MKHLVLIVLLAVGACAMPPADAQREAQAQRAFELTRAGNHAGLGAIVTDEVKAKMTDEVVSQMADQIPSQEPEGVATVQWHSNTNNQISAYRIVRQYEYPDATVVFDTTMVRQAQGPWQFDSIYVNRVSAAQAALGQFTLSNRSPLHYGVLIAAILAPVICLTTATFAGIRRRWGWMIFSLFGVGQFTFNWGLGAIQFQVLQFALLGAGFFKGALVTDPWIISFAIPIPALLFWALGKWKPKTTRAPEPTAPSQEPS